MLNSLKACTFAANTFNGTNASAKECAAVKPVQIAKIESHAPDMGSLF